MKPKFYLAGILVALLSVSLMVYATSYPGDQTVFYMDYASRYPYAFIIEYRNSTYIQAINGTNGKVDYVSTNASYVFNEAIDDLEASLGGTIYVKTTGTYTFDSELSITFPATSPRGIGINIVCEGKEPSVIFAVSSNSFVDIENSAWNLSQCNSFALSNCEIQHECDDATDITLDLQYCFPYLSDVRAVNTYGTKQGTFLKVGPSENPGKTSSVLDLTCTNYGEGFDIALDHFYGLNLVGNVISNRTFYLHDASYIELNSPQAYTVGVQTTAKPFILSHLGPNVMLINPSVEKGATLPMTNPMFNFEGTTWLPTTIIEPNTDNSTSFTLSGSYSYTKFIWYTGAGSSWEFEGWAYATNDTKTGWTFTIDAVTTPYFVYVSTNSSEIDALWVSSKGATQIVVNCTNSATTQAFRQVMIYWKVIV